MNALGAALRYLLLSLAALACTSPAKTDPQIWRPSGEVHDRIPGPMRNLGPFDSFSDALRASCPLILSKPNATVGDLQDRDPALARRVSTEYCTWLYFTPARKYELSMPGDAWQRGRAGRVEWLGPTKFIITKD